MDGQPRTDHRGRAGGISPFGRPGGAGAHRRGGDGGVGPIRPTDKRAEGLHHDELGRRPPLGPNYRGEHRKPRVDRPRRRRLLEPEHPEPNFRGAHRDYRA